MQTQVAIGVVEFEEQLRLSEIKRLDCWDGDTESPEWRATPTGTESSA